MSRTAASSKGIAALVRGRRKAEPSAAADGGTEAAKLPVLVEHLRSELSEQRQLVAALTARVAALEAQRVAAPSSAAPSRARVGRQQSSAPAEEDGDLSQSSVTILSTAGAVSRISSLESLGGGGEPCARCGKTVYVAERILARGNVMHRDCFRCARCDARLVNSPNWEVHAGTFYCGPHFQQIVSSGASLQKEHTASELQDIILAKVAAAESALEHERSKGHSRREGAHDAGHEPVTAPVTAG